MKKKMPKMKKPEEETLNRKNQNPTASSGKGPENCDAFSSDFANNRPIPDKTKNAVINTKILLNFSIKFSVIKSSFSLCVS